MIKGLSPVNKKILIYSIRVILLFIICFFVIIYFFYLCFNREYSFFDKIFSIIILISISFWGIHCIGYIDLLLKSIFMYRSRIGNPHPYTINNGAPKVAIFIPVRDEEYKIVETTVYKTTLINYENYEIFLLDNSTDNKLHKALVELSQKFNINYVYYEHRKGWNKACVINNAIKTLDEDTKYLLILDTGHRPKSTILSDIIPLLENDHTLTFVQTPRYFTSNSKNRLQRAYSFQQHIFHKHVCRGLDISNSVFMCGTNVLIRLSHLKELGGLNETCLSEDLATSFTFHSSGHASLYLDNIYARGIAPSCLIAYYTQQMRWAYGTTQNFKNVLKTFLKNPHCLTYEQWWVYLILNGTWYFTGGTFLLLMIYPIMVLLFGIQPLLTEICSILLLIHVVVILSQLFTSMRERGYRIKDLFIAQGLFFSLFPIYIYASICAMLNKKMNFPVTLKGITRDTPFVYVSPHLIIIGLLITSIVVGSWKVTTGEFDILPTYMIIFWAGYSAFMLSLFILYFYLPEKMKK